MREPPRLRTERLLLRPFCAADAPRVQRLAGDRAIADTTLNIPHPYQDGMAETWIATHADLWQEGVASIYAVVLDAEDALIGGCGLRIALEHRRAELGYWIGRPYWGQGFATEAAKAVVAFGFHDLGLHRVQARYMTRNPASGRVMHKLGMRFEGVQRKHVRKWDVFEDLAVYSILRDEFDDDPPDRALGDA